MAVMITTEDNPYDPRTNFPAWYAWDVTRGYHTCAYLAQVLVETDDYPQEYNDRLVEMAIDEIIEAHGGKIYKKLEVSVAA